MNRNRQEKGITLIALVITIIVLLILAGVTLSLTLGENGLLRRSQEAEGEYTKSSIKEELEMDITDMLIQNKGETLTKQEIADNIVNKVTITDVTDDIIEGEYKDYGIIIDENNNVIVGDKLVGEIPKVEITVLDTEVGIEKTTLQVIASTTDGEIESIEPMNGAVLKTENSNADKIYEVDKNGEYRFKVRGTNKRSAIGTIVVDNLMIEIDSESLLKGITELEGGGLARINVQGKLDNGTETKETYQVNITEYNKDLVLDGITPVVINSKKTITPNDNKTYEFGDLKDVATSTEMAQNTAVLKVNGNLTINEGVKVTTIASPNGYGGPKGMVIYCTGELINNGEISMTARGAKAVGQDVYLWRNASGNYEYVSKAGAIGGAKYNNSGRNTYLTGSTGVSGTLRQTGGGGSGGTLNGSRGGGYTIGREGGTGTSYSGGPGSGGISCDNRESTNAQIPEENGGAGGNGRAYRTYNMWTARNAAGGTGNPGGLGGNHSESGGSIGNSTKLKGNNGTGGLLVIFSSVFTNNGLITSMGTDSVNVGSVSGGASGAGSVNVFYNQLKNRGEFNVSGGKSVNYGGAGGNGTTTIGRIEAGTFVKE